MSRFAAGELVELRYGGPESAAGESATGKDMKVLRAVGRNINLTKATLTSDERRADLQVATVRHGFNRVDGAPSFELSLRSFDDILAYALGGSWDAVSVSGTPDLSATGTTNVFGRDAGSFVEDGFRPGDVIATSGFTEPENNGRHTVLAVSASSLTVDTELVTEAGASNRTLALVGERLDLSTTLVTFPVERAFLGIQTPYYEPYLGVAVNQLGLAFNPESVIRGTLALIGLKALETTDTPIDADPAAAPTTEAMDSFTGAMWQDGELLAAATGLNINLNRNRTLTPVLFDRFSPGVFEGQAVVTGDSSFLFENPDQHNKFINEEEVSVYVRADAPGTNGEHFLNFVMNRVKYTGSSKDPQNNQPVTQSMPWQALVGTYPSLTVQRSNTAS